MFVTVCIRVINIIQFGLSSILYRSIPKRRIEESLLCWWWVGFSLHSHWKVLLPPYIEKWVLWWWCKYTKGKKKQFGQFGIVALSLLSIPSRHGSSIKVYLLYCVHVTICQHWGCWIRYLHLFLFDYLHVTSISLRYIRTSKKSCKI